MSLITRAGDLVYTFRFLKLLVTKFEDTDAFKLGIIDEKGKRIKSKKLVDEKDRAAYTSFHRLVFNIKKLLEKVPGGSSAIASYAAALYLLREKYNLSDSNIEKIVKQSGLEKIDIMNESNYWFQLENSMLSPGIYKVKHEKLLTDSLEEAVNPNDKVKVPMDCYPIGNIFGMDVYKGTHLNTNKEVYFTLGEVQK